MKLYLFFIATLILVCMPGFASAQLYSVTPPVIEHDVAPRDILEDTIRITNTGTIPVKIFPSVHQISLGEDGSIKTFESPVMTDQTRNVTSWIAISRARIELQPGESTKIPVSITINPNAVPDDYYAFIGFGNGDKRDEAEAAVLAGRAPGVTMRISLSDTKNEYIRLHNFHVTRYVINEEQSLLTYDLENIGDTAVTPAGEVILYDVRGREVGALSINTENRTLSPGERVTFTSQLPDTGAFGRHKAFLNLEYGESQRANLYDTTFFTIVPLRFIIILFIVLLFTSLLLTLLYIFRANKRHQLPEDDSVALYVRDGVHTDLKDHDINLKHK